MPPEVLQVFQLHITGSQRLPPDLKAQLGQYEKYVQFHGKLFPEQVGAEKRGERDMELPWGLG